MNPEVVELFLFLLLSLFIAIVIFQQFSKNRLQNQIEALEEELEELSITKEKQDLQSRYMRTNTNLDYIKKIESLEKALQEEKKRVNDVKIIAQEANKVKSEFLTNVRHEIRTPMNSIMVFADLLLQELHDTKLKSYAKNIISSGEQLLHLLDDIIELSSVEGGAFKIKECATDVKLLLSSIIKKQQPYLQKKDVQIQLFIDENIPDTVLIDKEKVEEILQNLIENAVRYTEKGSITVSLCITGENILKNAVNLSFRIKDTGKGIDEKHLHKIFEIFEKPSFSSDELDQGAGLGLSINKKMAKAMQGDILVKSKLGEGSVFTFILNDVEVVLPSKNMQNIQEDDIDFSLLLTQYNRFVVVDMDNSSIEVIKNAFSNTAIEILSYSNTRDVLALLQKEKVDIIFIDVDILTSDDNAVAKILAKISDATIVTLTSHRLKGIEFFEDLSLAGHLMKPVLLSELFKVTLQALNYEKEENLFVKEVKTVTSKQSDPEDILSFLNDLKKSVDPLYIEANMTNDLASIEIFAKALQECSKKHHIDEMQQFSEMLLEKITLFDIDVIHSMMKEYQEKIENLKNF